MPLFVASLLGGLVNVAGSVAGQVLLSLGFAAVTYTGLSTTLDFLKAEALGRITALPADVVGLLATMKVGVALSIVVSALTARMLLAGLSAGGAISRLIKTS
jgi:hypothetical protein